MANQFNSSKEVEATLIKQGYSKDFCIAPFTTLLLEPDGKVGACRHKGSDFPVGNILNQNFNEIWNGPFIKAWRKEFLDGSPKKCFTEVKDRKCNLCPSYNSLLNASEVNIHQTTKPLRIAFNFNGHCNLECNMCQIYSKPNGLYDQINFWDQLSEWISDVQDIELLSGEPFIQKDTYKLIDLISVEKKDATWTITTNANWVLSNYVKEKLNKIKIKNIIVSLDCVNAESYAKIRKKGNYELALNTLVSLQKYEKERVANNLSKLNLKVNFLFQKENWKDLISVDVFSQNYQVEIFRTFLYEPFELSLLSCSENEKIEILNFYFENIEISNLKKCMRVIRPIIDSLEKINKFYFLNLFKELLVK